MRKNLYNNYSFSILILVNLISYFLSHIFAPLRIKTIYPLFLIVLMLLFSSGCIQTDKESKSHIEMPLSSISVNDGPLKDPTSEANKIQAASISYDPKTHLELDFHPVVTGDLFRISGDLILWGNTTLPYLTLNATIWDGNHQIDKARYLLIHVEPREKYSFDIFKNHEAAQEECDCILDVAGPFGSLFSEKRHFLAIDDTSRKDRQYENYSTIEKPAQNSEINSEDVVAKDNRPNQNDYIEKKSTDKLGDPSEPASKDDSKEPKGSNKSNNSKSSKTPSSIKNTPVSSKDTSVQAVMRNLALKTDDEKTNGITESSQAIVDKDDTGSADDGMFVGSSGSNKYHRPDCRFVAKIKNKIYFKSAQEARSKGKVPCKTCNPP